MNIRHFSLLILTCLVVTSTAQADVDLEDIELPRGFGIEVYANVPNARSLALADHGVHLTEGQRYKFHVFLHSVGDGPQSTAGIALVERVAAPDDPGHSDSDAITRAQAFARDGLWYDAFDAVSTSIEQGIDRPRAREVRAQLLDQVGLASVAEHERE